jgi:hypothetical protein
MKFAGAVIRQSIARFRAQDTICPLCHQRIATDVHHIINRGSIPSKMVQNHIPREYLVKICNACNLNKGEIAADSNEGRAALISHNIGVYGVPRMLAALHDFDIACEVHHLPFLELEFYEKILLDYVRGA